MDSQHKYERIDKGIKRSYAVKRSKLSNGKTIRERDEKGQAVSVIPPDEREEVIAEAIQRYVRGDSVQTISDDLNVARGSIYNWMLSDLGPTKYNNLVKQAQAPEP